MMEELHDEKDRYKEIVAADIEELRSFLLEKARAPVLSTNPNLRIVDSEEWAEKLYDIKVCLPDSIKRANSVLREAGRIVDEAKDEADAIVDEAEDLADRIEQETNAAVKQKTDDADRYYKKRTTDADNYDREQRAAGEKYYRSCTKDGDAYKAARYAEGDSYYNEAVEKADAEAERIIAEATARAEQLISENEITIEANRRAEELRRLTIERSNKLFNNAVSMADGIMHDLMGILAEYYNDVSEDRQKLQDKWVGGKPEQRSESVTSGHEKGEQAPTDVERSGQDDMEYDEYDDYNDEDAEPVGFFNKISERILGSRRKDGHPSDEE